MMKRIIAFLGLLGLSVNLFSQDAPKPYGPVPTEGQLQWHEMEMYCLIHWGANTYLDHEWGSGDEDPLLLNPVKFNAEQIVGAAKAGGFKGVIVVAKHHDGLCLWPTKTTTHNISQSKWKNGKGDILKEYQQACNKLGMKMGVYCSPWDRNNAAYGTPAYLEIYRNQLKELYSNYGPLFMSWHDGANGGTGYYGGANENRNIDRTTYYDWKNTWKITRTMQPDAVIFGDVGPDVRWVGNEGGHAGTTCWATITPVAPDEGKKPANGYIRSEVNITGTRNGEYWIPAECDVPLRPGWFYHAAQDQQVKTPYTLLSLYYQSVGRGADLDLGIAPDQSGLLNENDVAALKGFGKLLKTTFAVNLAKGAKLTADNVRGGNNAKFGPQFLLDEDRYSYWATDDDHTTPALTIDLGKEKIFNVIRLRENIKLGQRIDSVAVDMMDNGQWREIATATSIGANRLIRLDEDRTATSIRLRVFSPVGTALSDFGLYKEPVHIKAPVIKRAPSGMVTITSTLPVYYTLDGSAPSQKSALYKKPFLLAEGGIIKAVSGNSEFLGDINTMIYGIDKKNWKVLTAPEGSHAENALDENESTSWNTRTADNPGTMPAEIAVDMGSEQVIRAFTYLPGQDNNKEGLITRYAFYVSNNGVDWKKAAGGNYGNIEANPVQQQVTLAAPEHARYFKFSALRVNSGNGVNVAELGIITK